MYIKKFFIFIIAITFFSGCIEYEETLRILPNGWIRGEISLNAPDTFFKQMTENDKYKIFQYMVMPRQEVIKNMPKAMKIQEWYMERRGVNWSFHANFYLKGSNAIDNMSDLLPGQKITVSMNNGKIRIKRFIDLTDLGKLIATKIENPFFRKQLLLTSVFKYKIIVPTKIDSSNATKQSTKEAEWKFKLLDMAAAPQIMKITFETPPFYYFPIFWLILGFILVILYVVVLLKKL